MNKMHEIKLRPVEKIRNLFLMHQTVWIGRAEMKALLPDVNQRTIGRVPDHLVDQGFLEKTGAMYRLAQKK